MTKYIQEKIHHIDENLENKQYDLALNKIDEIESYTDYIAIDENRLNISLKKANAYYSSGQDESAMNLLLKGLLQARDLKNTKLEIAYSLYLGEIFKSAKNFNKSRNYYRIALKQSRLINDTINHLKSNISIGSTFYREDNLDSAIFYFKRNLEFPLTKNTMEGVSKSYNNLNVIAVDVNDLILAKEYGEKSLNIKIEQNDTIGKAVALLNLGNVYYKEGNFVKVKQNYFEAFESVENINTKKALSLKEKIFYNLAYANEELKNYEEAYKYLERATNLTDSLSQANSAQNISEIEAKYNVAQEASKTKEAEQAANIARYQFYGSAFAFIVLLALGYIFYRNYRLKQQSKLEQIENESQTKIINATIDAKEKERKSIAETLHDSVSALLSSANLHLQATKSQLKQDAPQEITKAQVIVNEASVKIRDLSHELISSVLLKFGLAFAVHDMCQKYSNSEITLHSDDNGVKRYNQDFEIKIHNIIEELINNILKHSKANNATIMLANRENDMLSIRISDDGVGFDVKKAKSKDGLGLSHINARIKVMKGVFNIVSSKNNGTSIFILVPIQHKENVA